MGLFQNKPQVSNPVQYSTFGLNLSILIVGLGNPGNEYDDTRHNIGFACLNDFALKNTFEPWVAKKGFKCQFSSQMMNDTRVILAKPTTFMNLSGEAVQAIMHFYKLQPKNVFVVHDELDVPFGQIRLRQGGSSAGHNGIKSVTQHIGEDYGRIRVGIGPKMPEAIDSADFVLQKFSKDQQADMPALLREVSAALSEYAYGAHITPETRSFL